MWLMGRLMLFQMSVSFEQDAEHHLPQWANMIHHTAESSEYLCRWQNSHFNGGLKGMLTTKTHNYSVR